MSIRVFADGAGCIDANHIRWPIQRAP